MREEEYLCEDCAKDTSEMDFIDGSELFKVFHNLLGGRSLSPSSFGLGRMASRLTEKAQRVLNMAEKTAKERQSAFIGTEHMLLGLFMVEDGIAARVLEQLGLNAGVLAEAIDDEANYGTDFGGLSPQAKRVLQLAVEEALNMGVNFVDTEHLLLGLAAEGEGAASHWLLDMADADLKRVRNLVIQMISQGMPTGGPDRGARGKVQRGRRAGNTPVVDEYGRDLTGLAKEEKLDPVVGREKEIQRVIQILSRRTKNNPVLIGEPGVGKTAIVEGLAQQVVEGKVPETLMGKRVVTVDMSSMVAGSRYRGDFEERMKKLVDEIRANPEIILFIDELHTLVGAGAAEGSIDAANILKPALSRGELQCVGATTLDEYRKHIEKDAALERRFQPVTVDEPSEEEAVAILHGLRDRYEAHHRVQITDEALQAAVRLSVRYLPDRFLPDKAIDLMDEASSMVRLAAHTAPPDLRKMEGELATVQKEKEAAVKAQEFEKAANLRDEESKLFEQIELGRKGWQKESGSKNLVVDETEIARVLADWTNIPVARLQEGEAERLLKLEELLHERVVGQEEAVAGIAKAMRRARSGLKDARRPIGSFIFLGPTGVGKTELARALAAVMFGSDDAMVRIDMSEYMEKHSVSRLMGAPPGYVGYDEGGQLTETVRRKPYSVVLLDEVEKAHPDVFNVLLQVLEDGRLTDSTGRTVDFRNTIVIMTSNVGAANIGRKRSMGFAVGGEAERGEDEYLQMKENMLEDMKRTFRPEFINRVDEIVVFRPLESEQICSIARLMVADVQKRLLEQDMTLSVSDAVYEYLAEEGFDPHYGARPLRRAVQRLLEDPLSEAILRGEFTAGAHIQAAMQDDKITFIAQQKLNPEENVECKM
jgi:ATP-dependent Clp protease ATP-binding subunit ClpC